MLYELPNLSFDYGALEPAISGRIMELHHGKHHAGYVTGANKTLERLAEDGGDKPDGDLAAAIDEHFGSFDDFKAQMTAATVGVQGSGWGALAWEPLGGQLIINQVYDHQSNVGQGSEPLLVIDAWEHAYYLRYLNDRAGFVSAIWSVIDWADVARRFGSAVG